MSPDDPRHGTPNGYINGGCRDDCCREAARARQAEYRKIRYCTGPLTVPALGTCRRLQALATLGWSAGAIGAELGYAENSIRTWRSGKFPTVHVDTYRMVAAFYETHCMTVRRDRGSAYAREHARRLGWFPPLAWDHIDDPDEAPPWEHLAENDEAAA